MIRGENQRPRARRRTGAAQTWNPDNIVTYWLTVSLLFAAVAAAGAGSIDGLLHAASWAEPGYLQWTLAVAADVFLVGSALASLALRKRGAYLAAAGVAVVTLVLVAFSASANWLYVYSTTSGATPSHEYGPWVKAAMPVLLLAATEIVAALTSTRNNRENSPLNRAKRDLKKARAEAVGLRKQLKAAMPSTDVEVS